MLAEVDEFLDETLTEIGAVETSNNRVDSVEYAEAFEKKVKQREQELGLGNLGLGNVEFTRDADGRKVGDAMFGHLDRISEEEGKEGQQDKKQ